MSEMTEENNKTTADGEKEGSQASLDSIPSEKTSTLPSGKDRRAAMMNAKGISFSVPKDSNLTPKRGENECKENESEEKEEEKIKILKSDLLESLEKLEELNGGASGGGGSGAFSTWERVEEDSDSNSTASMSQTGEDSLDPQVLVVFSKGDNKSVKGILKRSSEENEEETAEEGDKTTEKVAGEKKVSFDDHRKLSPRSLGDGEDASSASSYAFYESEEEYTDDDYFESNASFSSVPKLEVPIIPTSSSPFYDPLLQCAELSEELWMKIVDYSKAMELFQFLRCNRLLNKLAMPRLKKLQYERIGHTDRFVLMHLSSKPELASLVKHITFDLNTESSAKQKEDIMIPAFALKEAEKKFQKLGKLLALEQTNFSSMIPSTLPFCTNLVSINMKNPTNAFFKAISFVNIEEISVSWGPSTQKHKFDLGSFILLLKPTLKKISFHFAPFFAVKDQNKIIAAIGGCQSLESLKLINVNTKKKRKADHQLFAMRWPKLKSLSITSEGEFGKDCAKPLFWNHHSGITELQMYDSGLAYLQHDALLRLERLTTNEDGLLELAKHNENDGAQRPLKHICSTFSYNKEKPWRRLTTLKNLETVSTFFAPLEIAEKFSNVASALPPSCTFYCECRGVNLAKMEIALTWLNPIEKSLSSLSDHATIIFYSQTSQISAILRPKSKGGLVIDTIKKDYPIWNYNLNERDSK